MKITATEIKEFAELLQEADSFKPLAQMAADAIVSFGPQFSTLFGAMALGLAKMNAAVFNYYIANGFSREEAMLLTIDHKIDRVNISKSMKSSASSSSSDNAKK